MADKKELKEPPPPHRTVLDAFKKTSGVVNPAEIGFGTGARPSLTAGAGGGPGPGAYPIKSTLGKVFESNLNNPLNKLQMVSYPHLMTLKLQNFLCLLTKHYYFPYLQHKVF